MKIRTKLCTGFGFVVLAMLVVITFCLNTSKIACERFDELKGDIIPGAVAVNDMEHHVRQIYLLTMRYTALGEFEERQLLSAMKKIEEVGTNRLEHEVHIGSGEEVAAKELLRKIKAVNSAAMEVAKFKGQGATVDELKAKVADDFQPLILKLLDQVNDEEAHHVEKLAAAEESIHSTYNRSFRYGLPASAFVVLIAIGIVLAVTRSIVEPLKALHKGTKIIGQGNLDHRVGTDARDEIGQLSRAFDQMIADMKKTTVSVDVLNITRQQMLAREQQLEAINRRLHNEIAERKRVEKALEVSNGEFRDFVHMASHDLREPLRKISSFGMLLKDSLNGKLEKENQENLSFMINGAERMTRMIEDLLAYSRINTKATVFEIVDLNEVVDQLEQIELAALIEGTGAIIEIPQTLPKVQADPVLVRQLLQNLIVNGIEYCRDNIQPRILIRAEKIVENEVRIELQDNGVGIDKKHYKDIFKMFIRLHSKEKKEGAGSGLAVCKKIVDKHGGLIGIESKVGVGSMFWFTLPESKTVEQEQDKLVSSVQT